MRTTCSVLTVSCLLTLGACGDEGSQRTSDTAGTPDLVADTTPDTVPDTEPDTVPDASPDTTPADTAADAIEPDTTPDTTPDVTQTVPAPAITRFDVLPQPLHPGETAEIRVAVTDVTGCTFALDDWHFDISAADLAAGLVSVVPPESAFAAFEGAPHNGRPATLTCTGAAGATPSTITVRAVATLDPGPAATITATPSILEAAGTVKLCWDAPTATYCDIYPSAGVGPAPAPAVPRAAKQPHPGNDGATVISGQPGVGCVEDIAIDQTTYVAAVCVDDAGATTASTWVAVGPAVTRFEATPAFLAGPGTTTLRWDAPGTTNCRVHALGAGPATEVVPFNTSGHQDVTVASTTTFALDCEGLAEQAAIVTVIPSVDAAATAAGDGSLGVTWAAPFADSCTIDASAGGNTVHQDPLDAGLGWAVLALPPIVDPDWSVAIACDGPFGPAAATTTAHVDATTRAIDGVTIDPARAPVTGGLVDICWSATWASSCAFYWNGDGDPSEIGPGVGCITRLVQFDAEADLECCDDSSCSSTRVGVPVGPGIDRLVVDPPRLDDAGDVEVSWAASDVDRCVLLQDGAVVADALTKDRMPLAIARTSSLTLRCARAGRFFEQSVTVPVGRGISGLDAQASDGSLVLQWQSVASDACTLDVTTDAGASRHYADLVPATLAPGKSQPGFVVPVDASGGATITLTCTLTDGGTSTRTVTLDPIVPVEITTFTPQTDHLAAEGDVDVCWSAVGATSCSMSWPGMKKGATGFNDLPTAGCLSTAVQARAHIAQSTVFELGCYGPGGGANATTEVFVGPAITGLAASNVLLDAAGPVDISWGTYDVDSCTLLQADVTGQHGVEIADATSGTMTVDLSDAATFILSCASAAGPLEQRLVVVVGPTIVELRADPNGGDGIAVFAHAVGVDACTLTLHAVAGSVDDAVFDGLGGDLDGGWSWPLGTAGDTQVTLACTGAHGATSRTLTVTAPAVPVITLFAPSVASLPAGGGAFDLCWEATGVDGCWVYAGNANAQGAASGCLQALSSEPLTLTETSPVGISCSGPGGSVDQSATIPVGPSIAAFEVSPRELDAAGDVSIHFEGDNAEGCELTANDAVIASLASGDLTVPVSATTTFVLTCHDGLATTSQRAVVAVGPAFETLDASPNGPNSVSVSWTAAFVDTCAVDLATPDGTVVQTQTDLPAVGATWFYDYDLVATGAHVTVRCTSAEASIEGSIDVARVAAVSITSFGATPVGLDAPGEVDLCWSSVGATECMVSWPWGGKGGRRNLPANGCLSDAGGDLFSIPGTTPLQLACDGLGGFAYASLTVPVGPRVAELAATPDRLDAPGSAMLRWQTYGAASCRLLGDGEPRIVATASTGTEVSIDQTKTYTLVCKTASGDTFERALSVPIGPGIIEVDAGVTAADGLWIEALASRVDLCTVTLSDADGVEREPLGEWGGTGWASWDFGDFGDVTVTYTCFAGSEVFEASTVVASPLPRIDSFSATPGALAEAGDASLCWTVRDADGCVLAIGGDSWDVLPSQCSTTLPAAAHVFGATTDATLTCANALGTSAATTTVAVGPTITRLSASDAVLPAGGFFTTIDWEAASVQGCTLSDASEVIATGASGSLEVWVSETTTFTLDCTLPGSAPGPSADVLVTVGAQP